MSPILDLSQTTPRIEKALVGCILLDHAELDNVMDLVPNGDYFKDIPLGRVYDELISHVEKNGGLDFNVFSDRLTELDPYPFTIPASRVLLDCGESVVSASTATHYARQVRRAFQLRTLEDTCDDLARKAKECPLEEGASDELLNQAEQSIIEIAESGARKTVGPVIELADLVERQRDGMPYPTVSTGFDDIDRVFSGGLPCGEFLVLAGRPSMGKTAMLQALATGMARGGAKILVFSLEMSADSLTNRFLAIESGINSGKIQRGEMAPEEQNEVDLAIERMKKLRIRVDDTPGLTEAHIRSRARREVRRHDIDAIMIDYMQLLTCPQHGKESRQVEVSAISRSMKNMARETGVPVLCLAQLNRGVEGRASKIPMMSDLRESGTIEQDADAVMLLHRDWYYMNHDEQMEDPAKKFEGSLIVAKNRNGPTDTISLDWDPLTTKFSPAKIGSTRIGPYDDPDDRNQFH